MHDHARNSERRAAHRFECNKSAIIQITREQRIACTVLNVSQSGALIGLSLPQILPQRFELLVAEDLFQAECDLRHQNGKRAGVMFTSRLAEAFARFSGPKLQR